ncbi:hypothetical protein, partial [Actinoallomurus bryophytorum]
VPAHEVPAHEVPAHEVPAHEVPAHEVPAHEVPAHEVPAMCGDDRLDGGRSSARVAAGGSRSAQIPS